MMGTMVYKRYADDYENEITIDENGRERKTPVYHGKYYTINLDLTGISRFKRTMTLLTIISAGLHVGAGFVNNPGMNHFFVAVPYVVAFFPLLYLFDGATRLPNNKPIFKRDEIGLTFDRMRSASIFLLISIGAGILGDILYIVLMEPKIINELFYLQFELMALFGIYFVMRNQNAVQITEFKDEISET
jgi:hypothetical protein